MYNALDIAKWFIAYNNSRISKYGTEYISNLKLQKLLYYAFGTYSAVTGEYLFGENIFAWELGPVVKKVYDVYKCNGSDGIKQSAKSDLDILPMDLREILISVYEKFGQYSAWKLVNMTHSEEPWKTTPKNAAISREKIKDYFEKNYVNMERLDYFENVDSGEDETEVFDSVGDFLVALDA